MIKSHSKLSKNELRLSICEGIWKIKNWFLIESDSWTGKIALLIFV